MMMRMSLAGMASALALAAGVPALASPMADTVLWRGKVETADERTPDATAIAIQNGRVMAVGSDADMRALIGASTQVIDLAGRTVTPGLMDTHAHLLETGLNRLFEIDLGEARSIADITDAVAKAAAKVAPGAWIVGGRWDEGKLKERRYPTAAELDAAAPGHPVWLENGTGHYGVASSAALKLAGVSRDGPQVKAGIIERGPDGEATGVLKEQAQELVLARIPAYSRAQMIAAIRAMIDHLHAEGMTGFKDPALSGEQLEAYLDLARSGPLDAHVCVLAAAGRSLDSAKAALDRLEAARPVVAALPHQDLKLCGAKIFMDGSGAAPTAWMYEDWNQNRGAIRAGFKGFPQTDPEVFRQQVALFVSHGWGVGTHAIGDRSIDWVVDTYAAALDRSGRSDLVMSIIHANTPTDHAIDAIAGLQKRFGTVVPESQGGFAWWLGDIYAANLGEARSQRLNPFRGYEQHGIVWAGGSDSPVTPIEARYGLWASLSRQALVGTFGSTPFGLTQTPSRLAALKSYTAWAAPQVKAGEETGRLRPGFSADLAVWEIDPLTAPLEALKTMKADLTLYRGRVVYDRARASDRP